MIVIVVIEVVVVMMGDGCFEGCKGGVMVVRFVMMVVVMVIE